MLEKICEVTEKIFEDIQYSKKSEYIKEKINTALENEFLRLLKSGKNEVQSAGEIMFRYGSIESAAEFAGIKKDELLGLESDKSSMSPKTFKKLLLKEKLLSFLCAVFITSGMVSICQCILLREPLFLRSAALSGLFGGLFCWLYSKNRKKLSFDIISFSGDMKKQFILYQDKYKKRFVNSILVFTALVCFYTYLALGWIFHGSFNSDEIISMNASNVYIPMLGLLLCIKNFMLSRFILEGTSKKSRKLFWIYVKKSIALCFLFVIITLILALISGSVINPFSFIYFIAAFSAGIILNFSKRKKIVFRNLRINKLRIVVCSFIAVFCITFQVLKMGSWVIQPYILGISGIEHSRHDISYNDNTGVYTITADEENFKILHLTDIHLGGSFFSAVKDYKALSACYKLIENTSPDLVIVTGDLVFPMGIMSFSLNNETPVMQFAAFMRNIGIPWCFTYGNHDTEAMATGNRENIDKLYKSLSYKSSGTLLYPYIQPDITGRSNQLIKIENSDGSLRQALFLIDSNDYTGEGLNEYDYIHDDQVDWYEKQVYALNKENGKTVSSMIFFHIPLQEYRTAYELYQNGSREVEYYFGKVGEKMIDQICCSDYPSRLFEKSVELGSTKAMFCGHDHYNNISLGYKGIRLTYGMSIDYLAMPGIDKETEQRGAELITLKSNSEFNVEQIKLTDIY